MSLAGIFDDGQIVLLSNRHDGVHVGRAAAHVNRQDGRRTVGDCRLELAGVNLEGLRIGVDENG